MHAHSAISAFTFSAHGSHCISDKVVQRRNKELEPAGLNLLHVYLETTQVESTQNLRFLTWEERKCSQQPMQGTRADKTVRNTSDGLHNLTSSRIVTFPTFDDTTGV